MKKIDRQKAVEKFVLKMKRKIRKETEAHSTCPILILMNQSHSPSFVGEPPHWKTTMKGKTISYPNAYRRKGWSNMTYEPSSLRVEVGEKWILENLTKKEYAKLASLRLQNVHLLDILHLIGYITERKDVLDYVI